MKRTFWKLAALIAVVSLLAVSVISCPGEITGGPEDDGLFNAGSGSGVLFDIRSPYQNVSWNWGQYKAALHTHTINSDGSATMEQILQLYYDLDYDIMGITDHTWAEIHARREPLNDPPGTPQRMYFNLINKDVTNDTWTYTDNRTYNLTHITQAQKEAFEAGTAASPTRTAGRGGMLMIPGSGELAPGGDPTPDEVNVFFWPDNVLAPNAWSVQLRAGLQRVQSAGAIGFINHPGRSTHAMNFPNGTPANQANIISPNNPNNQGTWIRRYANLYMEFPISIITGMEIFNRRDQDSVHDRVLWDNVNKLTIPEGRFVWGYANDDMHGTSVSATSSGAHINFNTFIMPANNMDNFRHAMINGHSYMVTVVAFNEGVNRPADNDWKTRPSIQEIMFDKNSDNITIIANNATRIDWISDGKIIFTEHQSYSTIDLADPGIIDQVGSFVRANIIGTNGMAVIQPISTRRK